jgi:hypothetical protein
VLSIPSCCACTDRRPHTETYPIYIDGLGITSNGRRWSMYCSPCQDFHRPPPVAGGTHDHATVRSIAPTLSEQQQTRLTRAFGGTMAEIAANPSYVSPLVEMFPTAILAEPHTHATMTPQLNHPISEPDATSQSHQVAQLPVDPDDEGKEAAAEDVCKICFAAPPDALFLPCAHLVSCASCAVLVLTHKTPSPDPRRDEISGPDLIKGTAPLRGQQAGKLGYTELASIARAGQLRYSAAAVCPICRDSVKRWIRVYRS